MLQDIEQQILKRAIFIKLTFKFYKVQWHDGPTNEVLGDQCSLTIGLGKTFKSRLDSIEEEEGRTKIHNIRWIF